MLSAVSEKLGNKANTKIIKADFSTTNWFESVKNQVI